MAQFGKATENTPRLEPVDRYFLVSVFMNRIINYYPHYFLIKCEQGGYPTLQEIEENVKKEGFKLMSITGITEMSEPDYNKFIK